jgi:peptidoglycan/xylan/chitin deacetylase (PgdA/CDA1 family)
MPLFFYTAPFRVLASLSALAGASFIAGLRFAARRPILSCCAFAVSLAVGVGGFGALHPRSQVFGPALWRGDPSARVVALTFDDGPHAVFTPAILDILRQHGVKATFFMVGEQVERHPEIARRVVEEGHAVGNHTYTHPDLITEKPAEIGDEIVRTQEAILRATGVRCSLFRPPYGMRTPLVFRQTKRLGLQVVEWTISSQDWRSPGTDKIVKRVLRRVRPGAILLFHDGRGDRTETVEALPTIIEALTRRGYSFATIPEMAQSP